MSNGLIINAHEQKVLSFNSDIKDINPTSLLYTTRIKIKDIEYGFAGLYSSVDGKIKVVIPPMATVIKDMEELEGTYNISLDAHGDKYFLPMWKSTVEFTSPKAMASLSDTVSVSESIDTTFEPIAVAQLLEEPVPKAKPVAVTAPIAQQDKATIPQQVATPIVETMPDPIKNRAYKLLHGGT